MLIGDFLRQRREALELSQGDLAIRLELHGLPATRANISHWEHDRHKPPVENKEFRYALADALEISVNELMTQIGFITGKADRSEAALRAADIVDNLPVEAQEMALDLLNVLKRRYASE